MSERERLREMLIQKGFREQNGNSEWLQTQCPFCGDSPNPLTAHLNIRISQDNKPLQVVCFQPHCDVYGELTKEHLMKFGIMDDNLNKFVARQQRTSYRFMMSAKEYVWRYHMMQNNAWFYFQIRTGISLDFQSVIKYKIVLDIATFIKENEITLSQNEIRFINELGSNYMGFVNFNATQMRLRKIDENIRGPKFSTLTLVEVPVHEPYALNVVDDLSNATKCVHLGEGAFDAINVSNFFSVPNHRNEFYGLNSIKALVKCINIILDRDRNVQLYVYLDADISDTYMARILASAKIRYKIKRPVIFRRNTAAKDFGDLREARVHWNLNEKEIDIKEVAELIKTKRKRRRYNNVRV
jgi:hypothetical protein